MKSKVLAVDIGNTTVSLAVMKGVVVKSVCIIDSTHTQAHLKAHLKKSLNSIARQNPDIRQAIICSVVPKVLQLVSGCISSKINVKPEIVGRDLKVPLTNKYRKPRQVGQDRLVGAYAVKEIYGAPAIVIDFGTAITFDVISAKGDYEGGIIVPGIRMSAESLHSKTALLPKISVKRAPRGIIGKDTQESILSGLFHGYGAMCCGLIDRISKALPRKPKVIVTGGHTHLIKNDIASKITKIDKSLVFKGLALLSQLP